MTGEGVIINFTRRPGGELQELQICIMGRPTIYLRKMLSQFQIEAYQGDNTLMKNGDDEKLLREYLQRG